MSKLQSKLILIWCVQIEIGLLFIKGEKCWFTRSINHHRSTAMIWIEMAAADVAAAANIQAHTKSLLDIF